MRLKIRAKAAFWLAVLALLCLTSRYYSIDMSINLPISLPPKISLVKPSGKQSVISSASPTSPPSGAKMETNEEGSVVTKDNCLELRGSSGRWIQDWSYANRSQYPSHGSYGVSHLASQLFTPSKETPFRLSTSWRWQDDNCPVSEITNQGFCRVCEKLGVTRILILGDSLNLQFTMALKSLLGLSPTSRRGYGFNGQLQQTKIPCSFSNNGTKEMFHVTLMPYRRSPLTDFDYLESEALNLTTPNSHRLFVQNNPNRTIILANTGPWMDNINDYRRAFSNVVHWIESFPVIAKKKIYAFYRPSIPGHLRCAPPVLTKVDQKFNSSYIKNVTRESPYHNYSEYRDFIHQIPLDHYPGRKNWLEFEGYNQYSYDVLQNRSDQQQEPKIHWLNIFNSSVLRRDGHETSDDCLHYSYGGPVDWWVHFFYSMLGDLIESPNNK